VGILLVLLVIVVGIVAHPRQLTPITQRVLSVLSGADVRLERASVDWLDGALTLEGLELILPLRRGPGAKLAEAQAVRLDLELSQLWRGRVRATIDPTGPVLYVTEYQDHQRVNWELLPLPQGSSDREGPLIPNLPAIRLEHLPIVFGNVGADGTYTRTDTLPVEGYIRRPRPDAREYEFELRYAGDGPATQGSTSGPAAAGFARARLSGTIDAAAPSIRVNLDQLRLDQPQGNLLPSRWRRWWDELGPAGRVPELDVVLGSPDGRSLRLEQLVLSLDDVRLSPLGYALEHVEGRIELSERRATLRSLRGVASEYGLPVRIDGTIGLSVDEPFDLDIRVQRGVIPNDPRTRALLPEAVVQALRELEPRGEAAASVRVRRAEAGGPITYDGRVQLFEASLVYHRVPIPLSDVSALIAFSDEQVEVHRLTGTGPQGGTIEVSGVIAPPGPEAQVDLTVQLAELPVNEELVGYLPEEFRGSLSSFMDREAYAQRVAWGLIDPGPTPEDRAAGRDAVQAMGGEAWLAELRRVFPRWRAPRFDLGGPIGGAIQVHRPRGLNTQQQISAVLRPTEAGFGVLLDSWKYPLIARGGALRLEGESVRLEQIAVTTPTGGQMVIDGRVDPIEGQDDWAPELTISQTRLPIDPLLIGSTDLAVRSLLAKLRPRGWAQVEGRVFDGDKHRIGFEFDAQVQGSAWPFTGAYALRDATGTLRLSRDGLGIVGVESHHGAATLTVDGDVDFGSADRVVREKLGTEAETSMRLRFGASDLPVERSLLDLVPRDLPARAELLQLHERFEPEAAGDAVLELSDGIYGDEFRLVMQPHHVAFSYGGHRFDFDQVEGRAVLTDGLLDLGRMRGQFDGGSLQLGGWVRLPDDGSDEDDRSGELGEPQSMTCDLRFEARGERVEASLPAVLPGAVGEFIEALELQGPFVISGGRFWIRHPPPPPGGASARDDALNAASQQASALLLEGQLVLPSSSLTIGLPVTELDATLDVRVHRPTGVEQPAIDLTVLAHQARVQGRRLGPVEAEFRAPLGADRMVLREMVGSMYGGVVYGRGYFDLDREGQYAVELTAADVAARPLLSPPGAAGQAGAGGTASDDADEPAIRRGLVSVSLTLSGGYGEGAHREGRGDLRVRDAALFDQPLGLAVLQATNFAFPTARPFDRAAARFVLDDDRLLLDRLSLTSPNLQVIGAGYVTLPEGRIDLAMITRNPAAMNLGPLTQLWEAIKDELIAIRVTGTLREPEAGVSTLQGVRRTWVDVFGPSPPVLLLPEARRPER
jgi:hypothetical protein